MTLFALALAAPRVFVRGFRRLPTVLSSSGAVRLTEQNRVRMLRAQQLLGADAETIAHMLTTRGVSVDIATMAAEQLRPFTHV